MIPPCQYQMILDSNLVNSSLRRCVVERVILSRQHAHASSEEKGFPPRPSFSLPSNDKFHLSCHLWSDVTCSVTVITPAVVCSSFRTGWWKSRPRRSWWPWRYYTQQESRPSMILHDLPWYVSGSWKWTKSSWIEWKRSRPLDEARESDGGDIDNSKNGQEREGKSNTGTDNRVKDTLYIYI